MPRASVVASCALLFACVACAENARDGAWRYEIVATHPHDVASFTQGLALLDGRLLEGSGGYGRSALMLREIASGKLLQRRALAADEFGEGVAVAGERIVQLTWQSGRAFRYDLQLRRVGTFAYDGEGWGLASDGARWFMSDGSHRITLRELDTFAVTGALAVRDGGRPVSRLNELEYADGLLYANVWHSDRIAVIDPASGAVRGWIDLAALRRGFAKPPGWDEAEHVLNGIAFDPRTRHFYVTGKSWPVLFELRLLPPAR